jgi:predicted enzyme related to lactoylglutathione lyase
MAHGQITHIEFPADQTERAQKFYSGLFGWKFEGYEALPGYFVFNTGAIDSAGGAIGSRGEATGDKLRIYVTVDSIDEALAKVPGLGGKVTTPKAEIPGQGWYAVVDDSEGSEIGLYETLPEG